MGPMMHTGLLLRVGFGMCAIGMSAAPLLAGARVNDGDTLDVEGTRIRLHGIDELYTDRGEFIFRPSGARGPSPRL
jgi:hypothetical protein